ncbi:MAG TPA: DnaD domain protein [Tissierellaceae bacterium]|nr:DnaD domain protein [Tissierellaceae bacterium]
MKYTILGFQQEKANNLKLNMNDLLLMRVIKDMYSSAGMEFIVDEGDKYIWVKQDYLHEQIPIIGSKRTMLRIIDNLAELELLDKKVKHKKGKVKGTFFYIKPTTKMDSLQDYDPYDRLSKGGRQIVKRGMTKCHNKDTSITDTSITDTNNSGGSFKEIINSFQDNGFGLINASTRDMLVGLTDDYSDSWVLDAMNVAVENNARNLGYVKGILKKWQADGKNTVKPKANNRNIPPADPITIEREEDILSIMLRNSKKG